MSENGERELIPCDRMKEQVEREELAFIERRKLPEEIPPPRFSFEKGTAMVSFALPFPGDSLVMRFIAIAKAHLGNVRIHAFDDGYHALQALNKNLFKADNILDNLKRSIRNFSYYSTHFIPGDFR